MGRVVVSAPVKDLVVRLRIDFVDGDAHEPKGVPGTWRLYWALP